MEGLLFQVKPGDPRTFAVVSGVLAAVALLASYIPGRRATRVDPVIARGRRFGVRGSGLRGSGKRIDPSGAIAIRMLFRTPSPEP